jgi:hypothetical protein
VLAVKTLRRWMVVAVAVAALGFSIHELWVSRMLTPPRSVDRATVSASRSTSAPSPLLAEARARRARPAAELRPAELPAGRAPLTRPLSDGAFMRRYADDVCSCADQSCAKAVDRYFAEHLGFMSHSPEEQLRAHEEARRASTCIARLNQPS